MRRCIHRLRLGGKDVSLTHFMTPLGPCMMKRNTAGDPVLELLEDDDVEDCLHLRAPFTKRGFVPFPVTIRTYEEAMVLNLRISVSGTHQVKFSQPCGYTDGYTTTIFCVPGAIQGFPSPWIPSLYARAH